MTSEKEILEKVFSICWYCKWACYDGCVPASLANLMSVGGLRKLMQLNMLCKLAEGLNDEML